MPTKKTKNMVKVKFLGLASKKFDKDKKVMLLVIPMKKPATIFLSMKSNLLELKD